MLAAIRQRRRLFRVPLGLLIRRQDALVKLHAEHSEESGDAECDRGKICLVDCEVSCQLDLGQDRGRVNARKAELRVQQ